MHLQMRFMYEFDHHGLRFGVCLKRVCVLAQNPRLARTLSEHDQVAEGVPRPWAVASQASRRAKACGPL